MKVILSEKKEQFNKKHKQKHDLHIYYKRMMSDLSNAVLYIQDPSVFKVTI